MYSINKSVKKHMPPLQSARILDQLRERNRYLHRSLRTEEAYVYWARAFIRFHDLRHPAEMGKAEIEAYLMWLEINESDPLILLNELLDPTLFVGPMTVAKNSRY